MSVYEKISRVQAALAKVGIAKDQTATGPFNYKFRGIDGVQSALAPLLAEHKLLIMPSCEERTESEHQTAKGGSFFKTVVKVTWLFVDAEDGSAATACTYGEAGDSGDKGTNKAMSTAYKYMAFQTFCIPTGGEDDTERETQEVSIGAPVPRKNVETLAALPVCPSCGKKEPVMKSKPEFGGGFYCFPKHGGCGAKFGTENQDEMPF